MIGLLRAIGTRRRGPLPGSSAIDACDEYRTVEQEAAVYAGDPAAAYRLRAAAIQAETRALEAQALRLRAAATVEELRRESDHAHHDHVEAMRTAGRDAALAEREHLRELHAVPEPVAPYSPARTGPSTTPVYRPELLEQVVQWALVDGGTVPGIHRIREQYPPMGTGTARVLKHDAEQVLADQGRPAGSLGPRGEVQVGTG